MPDVIRIFNIEEGMPSVEEARQILSKQIPAFKKQGVSVMKLIHGYGSSGVGGKLRHTLRKSLHNRQKEGLIKAFVPGEEWSIFDSEAREIIDKCPDLKRDKDLEKGNLGITIILL